MARTRSSSAGVSGRHGPWKAQGPAKGAFARISMLSAVLFLCLAVIACSQEPPSAPALKTQAPGEAGVSGSVGSPVQVSGISSGSSAELAVAEDRGRPPVIEKVSFEPGFPVTGEQLLARVQASDPDGDEIKVRYRWEIDGEAVQESEDSTLNSPLHRGAFIEVAVIASNSSADSGPVKVSVFVGNASPTLRLAGQSLGGDNTYRATIEAADAEGDPVKFALKTGPPGMNIDPDTGIVQWLVRPEETGSGYEVQVAARDSEGAETLLGYQIKTRLEASDGIVNQANPAASSN